MNKNTNLLRRNSFRNLRGLQRTLDSFFNDDLWWPTRTEEGGEIFQPLSELTEDENNYYLKLDLPGMSKEEVKIDVENGVLKIQGERKEEKKDSKKHYSEIVYGFFNREFTLPSGVDTKKIAANYESGHLTVTIPKSVESKGHSVKIE